MSPFNFIFRTLPFAMIQIIFLESPIHWLRYPKSERPLSEVNIYSHFI